MRSLVLFVLIIVVSSFYATGFEGESASIPEQSLSDGATKKIAYNPLIIGGSSFLIPGAGQMYTRHFIKGGTFLASEALTASLAVYWFNDEKLKRNFTKDLINRNKLKTGKDSISGISDVALSRHYELTSRYRAYNSLAWASGIYAFNLLDAIESSNIVNKSGSRSPLIAGWLSAIPGLALGQWYNGSISKAGMIFMGQMSLGVMAINNHRLMKNAEKQISLLDLKNEPDALANSIKKVYITKWDFEQKSAFKARNSYLWYSLFFYFYGILDAVVDAHLHNYPEKMRVFPDLVPQSEGAQMRLNVKF